MRCKNIFIFVFGIFIFGLVSASYQFSEEGSSIISIYQVNDTLDANLNISFSNEPLSSTFSDSLGNSIELGDLLALDENYETIFDDLTNTTVSSAFQNLKFSEAGFKIDHSIGNITYKLTLNGGDVFEVTLQIVSNNNLIEQKLKDKSSQLNYSKGEIIKQDPFVQNILNEFLNMSEMEVELNNLQTAYENADTNEEYLEIINNLSKIKMPAVISNVINTDSIRFYPSQENINLDVLAEIGGGSYGNKREEYIGSIYNWNDQNLKTTLTFRKIAINYGVADQIDLNIFRFEFDKTQMSDNAYFIVDKLQDIEFQDSSSYPMQESSYGYLYISLVGAPNTIIFSTTQNVDFLTVPAFISPPLSSIKIPEVGGWSEWIDNSRSKWILFAVILFIVLVIGVITYILIHSWYRKKYEAHLFKTRNNLFNIMTYIQNAKKKEMPRDEIIKNLKKAGWSGEQISYAMRKYEGKKILGLIKMPVNITPETEKKPDIRQGPVNIGSRPMISKPVSVGPPIEKKIETKQNPPASVENKPAIGNTPNIKQNPPNTINKPTTNNPTNVNPTAVKKPEQNNQNKNTKV